MFELPSPYPVVFLPCRLSTLMDAVGSVVLIVMKRDFKEYVLDELITLSSFIGPKQLVKAIFFYLYDVI